MKIDTLALGAYQTNCYVLRASESSAECLIIDPGLEAEPLLDFLRGEELTPVAVVLTHGHADHIVGIGMLRAEFGEIDVQIHESDAHMLADHNANLSMLTGAPFRTEPARTLLSDDDAIKCANLELRVLHTPGHTPGGICLYDSENGVVFTDDALFAGSIGRSDFPGGDHEQLLSSVKERLFSLPEETAVYPGHGPASTIGREKAYNPFFS